MEAKRAKGPQGKLGKMGREVGRRRGRGTERGGRGCCNDQTKEGVGRRRRFPHCDSREESRMRTGARIPNRMHFLQIFIAPGPPASKPTYQFHVRLAAPKTGGFQFSRALSIQRRPFLRSFSRCFSLACTTASVSTTTCCPLL